VYVGAGQVLDHGAAPHDLIKKWNGTAWASLAGGLFGNSTVTDGRGEVTALGTDGTSVFAAGLFDAGQNGNGTRVNSTNIIKWDGTQWQPMGTPAGNGIPIVGSADVRKLVVSGDNVFVAGSFNTIGTGSPIGLDRFAKTGAHIQGYSLLKSSASVYCGSGYDLSAQNGIVYLAGDFNFIDGTAVNGFVQWNGGWSSVGSGVSRADGYPVVGYNVAVDGNPYAVGNAVFVHGTFDRAAGVPVSSPLRWILGPDNMQCAVDRRIGVGTWQTVAAKYDGTAWAWGGNSYGQVGDSTTSQRLNPTQVSNLAGVSAVIGGSYYSMALRYDGTVWTWGNNTYGQLGNNTYNSSSVPVQTVGLSNIIAISGIGWSGYALKNDGTVWAWGFNPYGEVGDGTTLNRPSPVQVTSLSGITNISGGYYHVLAMKNNGTVWAWGLNNRGQLGDGTTSNKSQPVQITGLNGVAAISAGVYHTLALSAGTVLTCGQSASGPDNTSPVLVSGLSSVVAIRAGFANSHAIKSDGTLWGWGSNYSGSGSMDYGVLGDGTTTARPTPVQITAVPQAIAVAGDLYHTIFISSDLSSLLTGWNIYGELGNGTTVDRTLPIGNGFSLKGSGP
jgi:alpha-tubulin suppressor-like RCC1 family protein